MGAFFFKASSGRKVGAPGQSLPDRKVEGTWPAPLALYLLLPPHPRPPVGQATIAHPSEVVQGPGTEYHVTIPRTFIGGLLGLGEWEGVLGTLYTTICYKQ